MASILGHGLAGATIAYLSGATPRRRLFLLAIVSAILPDIDSIGFFLGVPYGSPWGHRGFTHSILFALLWGGMVGTIYFPRTRLLASTVLSLATLSHGLFDAMTAGGLGVGFFIPFQNERYFFSWRPIAVSPLGVKQFFTARAFRILSSEMVYIGLPCVLAMVCYRRLRRGR